METGFRAVDLRFYELVQAINNGEEEGIDLGEFSWGVIVETL